MINIDGKYYDFGTKNTSFLQTAMELKTLGLQNYYQMLEVMYPNLGVQDLDPYSPDLTAQQIAAILIECKANPWYFFREVMRVPVRGAAQPYQTTLHRSSMAMIWCFLHSIDFMVCQPRQTFKTTWVLIITTYSFIFELNKADIPFMHLNESNVIRNAEMLRDYICALPPYMNPWSNKPKLPGVKSVRYEEHGVNVKLLTQADSDVKAMDKLRGWTLILGSLDEWEYIDFVTDVIAGAAPAMVSGRIIAEQNGLHACMMYSSTPGNLETDTGVAAQKMIDMTPKFFEKLYDMTDGEIESFLAGAAYKDDGQDAGEVGKKVTMLYIEFNYKQLRKDDAWLEEQYSRAVATNKIAEYRRGVLLDRFRGGDVVLFDQKDIDYIKTNVREPDYDMFILGKFHLYVYKHKIFQSDLMSDTPYFDIYTPYLVGIDVAAGGDGDNTAICVVNPYTLEIVAELESPYIGLFDLMRIIVYLAKLMPKSIFCVETNSVGKVIVDFVQESHLESRFYYDPEMDASKNAMVTKWDEQQLLEAKAKAKQYIGTYVSPTVRKNMFDLLKRHVKDFKKYINSKLLVRSLLGLVIKKGKIQAGAGEHDDMVMAYNHCIYVLTYGFDLTRFGIDKRKCVYEVALDSLKTYEKELEENVVDNMKPYDHPTMYEGQLLAELTGNSEIVQVSNMSGVDEYGYSSHDYMQNLSSGKPQEDHPNAPLTSTDYAFLSDVNTFF